jgi:uncharacterized protein
VGAARSDHRVRHRAPAVGDHRRHRRGGHRLPPQRDLADTRRGDGGGRGRAFASRVRGQGNLGLDYGWGLGRWWDLPAGAAIGLACQYLLIPLLYLPFEHIDRNLSHELSQPARNDSGAAHSVGSVAVLVLFLVVFAPMVEELFFRGLFLRALLGRTPPAVAIVVSGLVFALAHFEAVQFAGLAVFGVVLGVLAWRTGRLAPGIGAHAAFNAAAVIAVVHLK